RTTPNPWLVRLGTAYVELFRNIPLLVQMFLWYFVLPELLPTHLGDWLKQLPDASFYTAVVALGFYTSARVAEQVRAGILSLARAMQEFSFQVFEAFTAATIIYIVINIIVTFAMRYVEQRVAVPGLIGAKPAVATH